MTKSRDIASAIPAPSTISSAELGYLDGVTSAIQTQIDTKAPLASPTFTGTVTIPAGAYIAGDVSNFQIHSGVVLAIGD